MLIFDVLHNFSWFPFFHSIKFHKFVEKIIYHLKGLEQLKMHTCLKSPAINIISISQRPSVITKSKIWLPNSSQTLMFVKPLLSPCQSRFRLIIHRPNLGFSHLSWFRKLRALPKSGPGNQVIFCYSISCYIVSFLRLKSSVTFYL